MTDDWSPTFKAGERGLRSPRRTGRKGKAAGHRARGTPKRRNQPLIEQPIAQSAGTVRCQLCGCPVDPKRLHIHLVRFHGVPLRPGNPISG